MLRSSARSAAARRLGDAFDVLELRAAASLDPSPGPAALATLPVPDDGDAAAQRRFEDVGHDINDREMDMARIDFVARVGTSEVWIVRTATRCRTTSTCTTRSSAS